jgi:chromosome segregation protein
LKLKRLELYGFKSFADRTTFTFEDSLSALVGPNGSGKSNVVDAIKWVLGERSAQKLRGAEMANVIFNGSEGRKPLNFAEVKLVIDNSDGWLQADYEEVCIHRRIERTGQSDYFLNGKQCRLKDIRGLLLDTGIGTSAYSFIEQGQIDRILRASAKERRQVFEEAAGIHRFLEQKREAERKLERVGNNLARVADILEEVQRQLRSVKYQAARARAFKQQSERLQRLRLAHALHSLRTLEAEKGRLAREIASAGAERTRLSEQAAALDRELEAARDALQQERARQADAHQDLTRIEARLESLLREAELNDRRRSEFQQRLAQLEQRCTALQERAGSLVREVESGRAQLTEAADELRRCDRESAAARERIEEVRRRATQVEETMEARKAAVFNLFQQEAHLRNQFEVLGAEKRALQNRLARIASRRDEVHRQVDQADGERRRAQETAEALHAQLAQLEAEQAALDRTIAQVAERVGEIARAESETRADISGKVGRREVLLDLQARAEGVGSGVRKLLEANLPGTVGLVADLLDVPFERAPAVEAALGDRVQAVVFETADAARQALKLLAAQEVGRAEMIVLELLRPPSRVELDPAPGLNGRLADLVTCREGAAGAAEFLLGNAFAVDDAERAAALLRAGVPESVLLVTPAGECYRPDGVWAGGKPETPSLVSRRSELALLDTQVCELGRKMAQLAEAGHQAGEELERLRGQSTELRKRQDGLRRNAAELSSHVQVIESRTGELREELHLAGVEESGLGQDIQALESQCAALQADSERVRRERAEAQRQVEAEQEELRSAEQERHALDEEASRLAAGLARASEKEKNLQALLARLQQDRQHNEAELAVADAELRSNRRLGDETARAVESARAEANGLQGHLQGLREAIAAGQDALQQQQAAIEAVADRCRRAAEERQQVDGKIQELRLAENETAIKAQDMVERTVEDYGVRLCALQLDPEQWREQPPFTAKAIREHCENLPQPRPVAAWYREAEGGPDAEREAEDEAPEVIALEEAVELRRAVLETADDPATDWEAVREEAARLKARVDRIGNVNVAAIREQEELEVRLQFLTDQREDLEAARRHEREIIRELNRKSRERFVETLEQVRQNFQALFRKLFGGGTADIILEQQEGEDVLEAGIEMMARPPGKETNSISLLSGGERALTTVALLFAMFQAKPSPFCLLDEVDAPLDDNNVERFLMLLDEFRSGTQFIIITHNKLTMSVAQVLYGLTMADGVSKKISVKFEEVHRRLDAAAEHRALAG